MAGPWGSLTVYHDGDRGSVQRKRGPASQDLLSGLGPGKRLGCFSTKVFLGTGTREKVVKECPWERS